MRGTSVGRREGHGSPAIRLRTDDEMAAPLSLPLPFSASDPTKIVYANAKQSPNERCIVNPPPPSLFTKEDGTSWVHDSRDSWRRHLERGGSMPPRRRPPARHVCHMYGNGDAVLERRQFCRRYAIPLPRLCTL